MEAFFRSLGATIVRAPRPEMGITAYGVEPSLNDVKYLFNFYVDNETELVSIFVVGQEISITELLEKYGQPEEIWLSSDGEVPGPSYVRLALYYPEQGVLAVYWGRSQPVRDGLEKHMATCLDDFYETGGFWLWSPDENLGFSELVIRTEKFSLETFGRLGTVANLDEKDFYDLVRSNPENACIDTPAEIWPNPGNTFTLTPVSAARSGTP